MVDCYRILVDVAVHRVQRRVPEPQWFSEGTAELIHGADERLAGAVAGGNEATVVNTLSGGFSDDSAYAASRYLHYKLNEMLVDGGIKGIMLCPHDHQNEGLSEALNAVTHVARQRTNAGASIKRLEVAANGLQVNTENLAASRSRILDADYAAETASLTRSHIPQQAAAMVAQANSLPNSVLALLR